MTKTWKSKRANSLTSINITPFVDVLLVLVLTFLMTVGTIRSRGLVLPLSRRTGPTTNAKMTRLHITGDNIVWLDDEKVPCSELSSKLTQSSSDLVVTVEPGVTYETVLQTLNMAKLSGCKTLNIVCSLSQSRHPEDGRHE